MDILEWLREKWQNVRNWVSSVVENFLNKVTNWLHRIVGFMQLATFQNAVLFLAKGVARLLPANQVKAAQNHISNISDLTEAERWRKLRTELANVDTLEELPITNFEQQQVAAEMGDEMIIAHLPSQSSMSFSRP